MSESARLARKSIDPLCCRRVGIKAAQSPVSASQSQHPIHAANDQALPDCWPGRRYYDSTDSRQCVSLAFEDNAKVYRRRCRCGGSSLDVMYRDNNGGVVMAVQTPARSFDIRNRGLILRYVYSPPKIAGGEPESVERCRRQLLPPFETSFEIRPIALSTIWFVTGAFATHAGRRFFAAFRSLYMRVCRTASRQLPKITKLGKVSKVPLTTATFVSGILITAHLQQKAF